MASNAQLLAQTGELEAVLEARGFAYGLLAQAFMTEPSRSLVSSLAEADLASLFPYADQPGPIQQGVAETATYLADPNSASDEGYDRLLWDYTRLFIGPARTPCPPYESAYRTADRLLFQEHTVEVRKAYRAYGFVSAKLGSEPDDHLGLELQFLYETCRLAMERTNQGDLPGMERVLADQQRFLDEHLLTWAPKFATHVVENAQVSFYRGVAQMLSGFLTVDRRLLGDLLQEGVGQQSS